MKFTTIHFSLLVNLLASFRIPDGILLVLGVEAEHAVLQVFHIVAEKRVGAFAGRVHLKAAAKVHPVKALEAEFRMEH